MSEDRYQATVAGQEWQTGDANVVGGYGLMDDRLLADLIRQVPFDGSNVLKCIIPYGTNADTIDTVVTSGSANNSVKVSPFRAITGSTTALAASAETANWRDIRSAVFAGVAGSGVLTQAVQLTANSSGNPRIDLIYAVVSRDQNANNVTRKVKNAAGTTVTPTVVPQLIRTSVLVTSIAGTPAGSPTLPTTPADAGGNYVIPLAYVRVPNGATLGSTISNQDILPIATVLPLARATGARSQLVANQNGKAGGSVFTTARVSTWGAAAGGTARPGYVVPGTMVGSQDLMVAMNFLDAVTPANWSHPPTGGVCVVDDSRDWRNRAFEWSVHVRGAGSLFAWDKTASLSSNMTPQGSIGSSIGARFSAGVGQSFLADYNATVTNACVVAYIDNSVVSELTSPGKVVVHVSTADGKMYVYVGGFPVVNCTLFLKSFGPFPAY